MSGSYTQDNTNAAPDTAAGEIPTHDLRTPRVEEGRTIPLSAGDTNQNGSPSHTESSSPNVIDFLIIQNSPQHDVIYITVSFGLKSLPNGRH